MYPEAKFEALLLADDPTTALIGDRVVPAEMAPESEFPNIAVTISGDVPSERLSGPGGHTTYTVDVAIRSLKYANLRAVCAAVSKVLQFYRDTDMPLCHYTGGQSEDDDRSFKYVQSYEVAMKN